MMSKWNYGECHCLIVWNKEANIHSVVEMEVEFQLYDPKRQKSSTQKLKVVKCREGGVI